MTELTLSSHGIVPDTHARKSGRDFPFSDVVGQNDLKLALLLVAIDPTIGGVLISGEHGTGKSTAARGVAALLPQTPQGEPAPFVELPLGATEDRVLGALARAEGGVLYVDEVNLLPDPIVDLLLNAAGGGRVSAERDGISAAQGARFILIGTLDLDEGELRPQFVDRFGLCVQVRGLDTPDERIVAIRRRLQFDDSPMSVLEAGQDGERVLRERVVAARARLGELLIADAHLESVAALSIGHHLGGIRGDIAVIKAARALAAWQNAPAILDEHIGRGGELALPHRTVRRGNQALAMHQGAVLTAPVEQQEGRSMGRRHVLFLVDASGSPATQRRLELAKGAALGLLTSGGQRREEVALMAFRGSGTDLVLPFTRHIANIEAALNEMHTGGRTPLARGLLDAAPLLHGRDAALLVLLTDGCANVSIDGKDPWVEALAAAALRTSCAGALVIDCEPGPIAPGRPRMLAEALGAQCVALDSMDGAALTVRIRELLENL
jgi:Mg-chelatase subunit ChlI